MRDIIFRAFSEGEMKKCGVMPKLMGGGCIGVRDGYNKPYTIHSEVDVMQFTGLKDVNGVMIFEGDIIRTAYKANSYDVNVVEYDCGIGFTPLQEPCDYDEVYLSMSDVEVIGNIHQDPELLT